MRKLNISSFSVVNSGDCSNTFEGKYQDKLIFKAGVTQIAPGIGEIWNTFEEDPRMYRESWRQIKTIMSGVWGSGDFHRLQSHVKLNDSASIRFNLHLGMEIEGILKRYLDREDYILMARVE